MEKIGLLLVVCGVVVCVAGFLLNISNKKDQTPPLDASHRLISSPEDDNSGEEVVWIVEMTGLSRDHDWTDKTPNGAVLSANYDDQIEVRFSVYGDHYRLFGYELEQLAEVNRILGYDEYVISFDYTPKTESDGIFSDIKGAFAVVKGAS